MDSSSEKKNGMETESLNEDQSEDVSAPIKTKNLSGEEIELEDENLTTLQKIHAILLHCINMDEKEKWEFANSQRYFMKLYLKKLRERLRK
ncbi:MAG: hypothetical protein ACFE8N_05105 [Promethearchaeota archaeon]